MSCSTAARPRAGGGGRCMREANTHGAIISVRAGKTWHGGGLSIPPDDETAQMSIMYRRHELVINCKQRRLVVTLVTRLFEGSVVHNPYFAVCWYRQLRYAYSGAVSCRPVVRRCAKEWWLVFAALCSFTARRYT